MTCADTDVDIFEVFSLCATRLVRYELTRRVVEAMLTQIHQITRTKEGRPRFVIITDGRCEESVKREADSFASNE